MTPTACIPSSPDPAGPSADPASPTGPVSCRTRRTDAPLRLLLAAWTLSTALVTAVTVLTAGRPPGAALSTVTAAARRRLARHGRDAGLTTVEVAIITAVLLGLATALVAAITIVVNRNTSKIK